MALIELRLSDPILNENVPCHRRSRNSQRRCRLCPCWPRRPLLQVRIECFKRNKTNDASNVFLADERGY